MIRRGMKWAVRIQKTMPRRPPRAYRAFPRAARYVECPGSRVGVFVRGPAPGYSAGRQNPFYPTEKPAPQPLTAKMSGMPRAWRPVPQTPKNSIGVEPIGPKRVGTQKIASEINRRKRVPAGNVARKTPTRIRKEGRSKAARPAVPGVAAMERVRYTDRENASLDTRYGPVFQVLRPGPWTCRAEHHPYPRNCRAATSGLRHASASVKTAPE